MKAHLQPGWVPWGLVSAKVTTDRKEKAHLHYSDGWRISIYSQRFLLFWGKKRRHFSQWKSPAAFQYVRIRNGLIDQILFLKYAKCSSLRIFWMYKILSTLYIKKCFIICVLFSSFFSMKYRYWIFRVQQFLDWKWLKIIERIIVYTVQYIPAPFFMKDQLILTIYRYQILLKYFTSTIEIHECVSTNLIFNGTNVSVSLSWVVIRSRCASFCLYPWNKVHFITWFLLINLWNKVRHIQLNKCAVFSLPYLLSLDTDSLQTKQTLCQCKSESLIF